MSRSWAMSEGSLKLLDERLQQLKPRMAVECGSGLSTKVLRRHCGYVVSLEHLPRYAAKTHRQQTRANGQIALAEIVDLKTEVGPVPFYAVVLPYDIDFALIDGPPSSIGREGTLFALAPHLRPGATIWLDDRRREAEHAAVQLWLKHLPVEVVTEVSGRVLELTYVG